MAPGPSSTAGDQNNRLDAEPKRKNWKNADQPPTAWRN